MKKLFHYHSALFISLIVLSSPSYAEFSFGWPSPIDTTSTYIYTIGSATAVENLRDEAEESVSNRKSATKPSATFPELSSEVLYKSLAFTPNIQRRQKTLTTLATELAAGNPGRGAEIKAALLGDGSGDIIQKLEPALSPIGLSADNLADAYTAYWITAWEASRGIFNAPSDIEQIAAVKDLTTRALGKVPQFAKEKDADKQAFAEVLWVQTLTLASAAQGVAGNPSTMPQFKAAVRAQAKSLGVDLDSFNLTPDGFELAK